MSNEKTIMGANKIVSLEEVVKDRGIKEPVFSKGLYHWVMFILSLYTRVKEKLNIDFESFENNFASCSKSYHCMKLTS